MAKEYDAHLFICTNLKGPGPDGQPRASCAAKGSEKLRESVKSAAAKRFAGQSFRVNASGCLGACEEGIAAVCFGGAAGGQWQTKLDNTPESAEVLLRTMEDVISS